MFNSLLKVVHKGENSNGIYALLMMSRVKVREMITFYPLFHYNSPKWPTNSISDASFQGKYIDKHSPRYAVIYQE